MLLFTINLSERVIIIKYIFRNNNTFITSGYGDYEQEDLLPDLLSIRPSPTEIGVFLEIAIVAVTKTVGNCTASLTTDIVTKQAIEHS